MRIFQLGVTGRIPTKKNSRRNIDIRSKNPLKKYRRISLPSVRFCEWENQACIQLLKHKNITIQNIQEIQMDFYFPDNAKTDLDNKSSSVLDLLVKMGIIEDDRWQITGSLFLRPAGIDKTNPRVEIFVKAEN